MKLSFLLAVTVLGICCFYISASKTNFEEVELGETTVFNYGGLGDEENIQTSDNEEITTNSKTFGSPTSGIGEQVLNLDSSPGVLPSSLLDSEVACAKKILIGSSVVIGICVWIAIIIFYTIIESQKQMHV